MEARSDILVCTSEPFTDGIELSGPIEQGLPLTDAPVMAAALACGADALVTGYRTHFGHRFRRKVRTLVVLTPAGALARLRA
jgi:hypothetical protein